MSKKLLFRLFALVAAMMCALGMQAAVGAYANYTPSNTTLTFYYDNQRSSRTGTTYDLNIGYNYPDWYTDGTYFNVTNVVFDPSFAVARPTSTIYWFFGLSNLQSITGLEYLNTSEVTDMAWMFFYCTNLTSLDLSHFNTSKVNSMYNMLGYCQSLTSLDLSSFNTSQVISMSSMFDHCANLRTIYVGDGWNTAAVTISQDMFNNCTSLVGGQGTAYDANHVDAAYAHIDGGPSNPGYFTAKNAGLRGDVNGDGEVNISDVTLLINAVLNDNFSTINQGNSDMDGNGVINVSDVTALIAVVMNN